MSVARQGRLIGLQRRLAELGRLRYGEVAHTQGGKPYPRSLNKWRLTSASKPLLEQAAEIYGGKVRAWKDAPDEGMWELYTTTAELDVLLPPVYSAEDGTPTYPYMQAYELWTGPTLDRRCDGETCTLRKGAGLSTVGCLCDPDARECQVVTRITVMLPRLPGLGVWRMDSKGWNVATQLPGALDLLSTAAAQRRFLPALLRLEPRSRRVRDEQGKVQTNRFVVPVLDLQVTPGQMLSTLAPELALPRMAAGQVGEESGRALPGASGNPPAPQLTANVPPPVSKAKPVMAEGPEPEEGGYTREQIDFGPEVEPEAMSAPSEENRPMLGDERPAAPAPTGRDPWMAAIHAIGDERGMDHDAIHDFAATLFPWDDFSLTNLQPPERAMLRRALEAIPKREQGETAESHPEAQASVTPATPSSAPPTDTQPAAASGEPPKPGSSEYAALRDGLARSQARAYWQQREKAE